jgi:hypothetical protein
MQLVLRKVAFTPTAIPTTGGDAVAGGTLHLGWQIGLAQANAQVSNIGTPTIVNIRNPNLGVFMPDDPAAATLPLSPGERAYATLRVMRDASCIAPACVPVPSDPLQLLQYGVKVVAVDASNKSRTHIPLIVETLSLPAMTALSPTTLDLRTFGGYTVGGAITGTLTWTDVTDPANPVALTSSPIAGLPDTGVQFTFARLCPTITPTCTDDDTSVFVPNPPGGTVTPSRGGTFSVKLKVSDRSIPPQSDEQLYKVVVAYAQPDTFAFPPVGNPLPASLPYGERIDLSAYTNIVPSTIPVSYSTTGPCHIESGQYLVADLPSTSTTCQIVATAGGLTAAYYVTVTAQIPVSKAVSVTTLAVTPNPVKPGQAVTLKATVSRGPTSTVTAVPTQTVTFYNGTASLGSAALTTSGGNGVATLVPTSPLSDGSSLTASYSGDVNFLPSSSAATTLIVTSAAATLSADANSVTFGTNVTFTATMTVGPSGAGTPTGTLKVIDTLNGVDSALATCTLGTSPTCTAPATTSLASCTVAGLVTTCIVKTSSLALGSGSQSHSLKTTYRGDSLYPDADSTPAISVAVLPAPTTTQLTVSPSAAINPSSVVFGTKITLSADVTPRPNSGTISFADATTSLNSQALPLSGGWPATFAKSDFSAGQHSLTAAYSPPTGGGYAASTSSIITITITSQFSPTGNLKVPRVNHTATLLNDGRVLVTGGQDAAGTSLQTAEIYCPSPMPAQIASLSTTLQQKYCPAPGQFQYAGTAFGTNASGKMVQPRNWHTATLLADGTNKVLLAAGLDARGAPTATSELYDPATDTFIAVGNLPSKAAGHTATLLPNGLVFAAGGGNSSAELYNPATKTWNPSGGMSGQRSYHTATLIGITKVLLAGGADNSGKTLQSTTIYDIATGTFTTGPTMLAPRERHTAAQISADGTKILLAGGRNKLSNSYTTALNTLAEIYDPSATLPFTALPLVAARFGHTGIALPAANGVTPSGRVFVAGGASAATCGQELASSELFATNAFTAGSPMAAARSGHTATTLKDGRVLVAGGAAGSTCASLQSAEIWSAPAP